MRKILAALPCLLFSGLVLANEAPALDERQGAAHVLMASAFDASPTRNEPSIRLDGIREAAKGKRKATKAAPKAAAAPAAQPTDTSKRFNMTQDGKRMTADDFDAWMKKNGYRVATGAQGQAKEAEPTKGSK